jgi:hypothetical protein
VDHRSARARIGSADLAGAKNPARLKSLLESHRVDSHQTSHSHPLDAPAYRLIALRGVYRQLDVVIRSVNYDDLSD